MTFVETSKHPQCEDPQGHPPSTNEYNWCSGNHPCPFFVQWLSTENIYKSSCSAARQYTYMAPMFAYVAYSLYLHVYCRIKITWFWNPVKTMQCSFKIHWQSLFHEVALKMMLSRTSKQLHYFLHYNSRNK